MAFFLTIVKAIIEIAGFALIAQFLVAIFAWQRRHDNVVYRLFAVVTRPFTWLTRKISPRLVLDQHVPLVTFMLLFFIWLVVVFELRASCLAEPLQQACIAFQANR